jgi:hypothetical protein
MINMKRFLVFFVLILMWSNSSQSSELPYFKCKSLKHNDISEFEVLYTYKDGFMVFSHTIMDVKFLNFGHQQDGVIRSFMSDPATGGLMFYDVSKIDNNKNKIVLRQYESDNIKNLNSKSIFYGKTQGKINLKLTDNQLNREIDNLSINQKYLIDLFNNRKDQIENELIIKEKYSCEKISKPDPSKPSKDQIEAMRLGCIGDNPYEKRKNFCTCYSDWFYTNLNKNEFAEFLYLSKNEQKKILDENNVIEYCEALSPFGSKLLKKN